MSKLRFAQAGVSLMHAAMYRDTLMLLSDEIELVGFYDPDPDAVRERVKPDAAHVPFYPDLGALLATARPDAVMVSTYPVDMPTWMLQIVRAGVHLWAEKHVAARAALRRARGEPHRAAVAGAGRLDHLQFAASPALATRLVAEIEPGVAAAGTATTFAFRFRPQLEPEDPGFDTIAIDTPALPSACPPTSTLPKPWS